MHAYCGSNCQFFACGFSGELPLGRAYTSRISQSASATRRSGQQCTAHAAPDGEKNNDGPGLSPTQLSAPQQQTRRGFMSAAAAIIVGAPALRYIGTPSQASAMVPQLGRLFSPAGPQPLTGDVKAAVSKAFKDNMAMSKAPVMLRLVFHDAATFDERAGDGGADASVFYELNRPENKGLKRGWRVIEEVQAALKGTAAEGCVSTADLIVLAGAYAVSMTGGPLVDVGIGRKDALAAGPADRLPAEDMSADVQRSAFAAKSLSVREMVALLGAHTLGAKGFGDPVVFDNAYYTALLAKPWAGAPKDSMANMIGLPSDKVIADDFQCLPIIQEYADDQEKFFQDFSQAYLKLANLGATWT